MRPVRASLELTLACLTTGCAELTAPAAPPLDIRGTYAVVWFVGYTDPEGNPAVPDPSLPRGECSGTVTIQHQTSRSFSGTIRIPDGVNPPCHPAIFELAGKMTRVYTGGENPYDYGWDLFVASDVELLLDCSFAARPPGNTNYDRGVGRIDPAGLLRLAFGNIYECGSGRWWIVAGADGARSGP